VVTMTSVAIVVGAVALERIVELAVSRRNERRLRARGGREHGAGHYPVMVLLHVLLLVGCLVERGPLLPVMLVIAVLAQALRWWAIGSLGEHWCTRVIVVPDAPRVVRGPYRFFPHPNYVAVVIEGLALPLVHSAWITAIAFTVANACLLAVRIRTEDRALTAMRPAWT